MSALAWNVAFFLLVLLIVGALIYGVVSISKSSQRRGSRGATGPAQTGATGAPPAPNVITFAADGVLTAADSPAIVLLNGSSNTSFTVTLPPVTGESNLSFRFVISAPSTADINIAHPPDKARGLLSTDIVVTDNQGINNGNIEFFVGGAQTVGDFMNYTSDTLTWQLFSFGVLASSLSFTP